MSSCRWQLPLPSALAGQWSGEQTGHAGRLDLALIPFDRPKSCNPASPNPPALTAALPGQTAALPCPAAAAQGSGARPVTLVDVPGHPRVRGKLESYLDHARGVVFVVDSVDFMPKKTETAE